jgi:hypothetical protein
MTKDPSPLLGYNNNIRHKNRVFHIQTEDSGVRHPHVITHLFMDGGRILKSVKTSYAEHVGAEKMADTVRKMMKDQHKGMLIALRDGQFDVVIDGGTPAKAAPKAAAAVVPAPDSAATVPASDGPVVPESGERASGADVVADVAELSSAVAAASAPPVEARTKSAPSVPPPARSAPVLPTTLDKIDPVEISEREEDETAPLSGPGFHSPLELTPPPANLFRPRATGSYRELGDPSAVPDSRPPTAGPRQPSRPPPKGPTSTPPGAIVAKSQGLRSSPAAGTSRPSSSPSAAPPPRGAPPIRRGSSPPPPQAEQHGPAAQRRPVSAPVAIAKPSESRYASARPAAIFGQAKPRGGSSIFGEDIISDKSLDEVILSYLAEDVGPSSAPPPQQPAVAQTSDPKRRK